MDKRNQKENKEILSTWNEQLSNPISKYPFASNPTILPQDMNYKDVLKRIQGDFQELDPLISTRSVPQAVQAAVSITATILSGFVPVAGPVLSVLTQVLGLLWPSGQDITWENLMKRGEELFKQTVEESIKYQAEQELIKSQSMVTFYQVALDDWINTPGRITAESMRDTFRNAIQQLDAQMSAFKKSGYEVPLLPTYAQAANLNVIVLKDITIFGEQWGFEQSDIDYYYKLFLNSITNHTDYVSKWYQEGLNRLPKLSSTDWIAYNRFRREMTLMALDIIALFPTYDAFLYPMETKTELTRELYMDPEGGGPVDWKFYPISFENIESKIRQPDLFTWLDYLQIQITKILTAGDYFVCMWDGSGLGLHYTNSSNIFKVDNHLDQYPIVEKYTFSGNDVYQTLLYEGSTYEAPLGQDTQFTGNEAGTFNLVSKSGTTSSFNASKCGIGNSHLIDSVNVLPPDTSDPSQSLEKAYTHRLSYVNHIFYATNESHLLVHIELPLLGWTHRSVSVDNPIYPDKITQIPAVKMYELTDKVIQGPGFTGGNLVKRGSDGTIGSMKVTVNAPLSQKYLVRIRYATNKVGRFDIYINDRLTLQRNFEKTEDPIGEGKDLTFNSFGYIQYDTTIQFPNANPKLTFRLANAGDTGVFYIDKIEFIPVDANYNERVTLEKAQKAVNALFTVGGNALQTDVTDYKVDQVSILVDCVPGELYPNEKRELQNLVKYAKRLSNSRNLLIDPNFESINSENVNGWYGSNGIVIGNGDAVFKGNYVQLFGTNYEQYPTYLYQKIDESKLKEYTRYKLRGFIKKSQDLEVYVVRYDAKHETLNVLDNLFLDNRPVNACGGPDRCMLQPYLEDSPTLECSSIQDGILSDSHTFSLNIDTGSIDYNENLGIWVLLKISTSEGYATFGNVEVIEEKPLVGEALARVKRQETKWRTKVEQLRADTQAIYARAKQAIDVLFTDAQVTRLHLDVTFGQILAARKIIQSIREAYMPWLSVIPGINYNMFTELNSRIQQAFALYDLRNVVQNGRFVSGLNNWVTTSDVSVQEEDGNRVLVLSGWDAQVLQQVAVFRNRGYILRVTASKEGHGEGSVTIYDGEGNTDILTFSACHSTHGNQYTSITGYVTKELEFFPETEQVYIEIGETEGTFKVESVELFLMEELC